MIRAVLTRTARTSVLVGLLLLGSCQYVGDRAMDFVDQFRIVGGVGVVGGVRSKSLGLFDTGLMFGLKPRATAIGMFYGVPLFFNIKDSLIDTDQVVIIKGTHLYGLDYGAGSYESAFSSAAVLPGILSWGDATPDDFEWVVPEEGADYDDFYWIWTERGYEQNRWAQIHAFDVEVGVAFFLYLDSGYSPGETLDFLLGLVLIDIAGDDGRL